MMLPHILFDRIGAQCFYKGFPQDKFIRPHIPYPEQVYVKRDFFYYSIFQVPAPVFRQAEGRAVTYSSLFTVFISGPTISVPLDREGKSNRQQVRIEKQKINCHLLFINLDLTSPREKFIVHYTITKTVSSEK